MVRILILGSSGYLGKSLFNYLKKKYFIYNTGISKKKYDLTKNTNLKKIIFKFKPNLIINCIGLTNIDDCEKKPRLSKKINVNILKNIFFIRKKNKLNFKLIHISTDQVYNPKKNILNKEINNYIPLNVYSKHKLLAEKICINNSSIVFRTNLIGKSYSKKKSFTDWIYNNLKKNYKINGFVDSYYSPLSIITICKIIDKIIINNKLYKVGIFNLGSKHGISKYNLIKTFLSYLKMFKKNLIIKTKINNICSTFRTKNNRLCVKKFENNFKIKLPKTIFEIKKISNEYK